MKPLFNRRALGVAAICLMGTGLVHADTLASPVGHAQCSKERQQRLDTIVLRKLEFYEIQFPDIQIFLLKNHKHRAHSMTELLRLLGQDAANLDYEHPPRLRADLLEVSLDRVEILLHNNSSSSALFRVGESGQARRQQLCVLTLDSCGIAKDNYHATRHLLGVPEQVFAHLPVKRYLHADQHLEFVIDHEIHHCLVAHRGEPIPMSMREYWANYMQWHNEKGADVYGLIMHAFKYGADTNYAKTLIDIRGMSLLVGDPDHYSCTAMMAAMQRFPELADNGSVVESALAMAAKLRDETDCGYEEYLKYRYAASRAMRRFGITDPIGHAVLGELPDYKPEPARVDTLLREASKHYQQLLGGPLPGTAH